MKYHIGWSDEAIDGLAILSLLHQDRWADINGAVDIIEYRLQRSPLAYGRAVSEGLWRIDLEPIGLSFAMSGQQITVESIGWLG